jgi:hypothetical protein
LFIANSLLTGYIASLHAARLDIEFAQVSKVLVMILYYAIRERVNAASSEVHQAPAQASHARLPTRTPFLGTTEEMKRVHINTFPSLMR